jgi:putative tryptophan/tyrosine transport system substrate-binding protein
VLNVRENQVRRRELIALLGGSVAAWPLGALAEQPALPVIGFLSSASVSGPVPTPFRKALNETGFFPDQNVTIEIHQADGHYDRLPALAADFANRNVNVIVAAGGLVSAQAARKATSTIPILFIAGFDPIKLGLVASYSRPDGNATGVSIYTTELLGKRLSLLLELMPNAERLALLINASNVVSEFEIKDMKTVAAAAGVRLIVVDGSAKDGIESAFALAVGQNADALLVSADPFFSTRRRQIVALAAHYRLPAAYPWREYAEAGGHSDGRLPSARPLRRAYPQGRKTERPAGAAAKEIRAGGQPRDRRDARPHGAAHYDASGRPSDRLDFDPIRLNRIKASPPGAVGASQVPPGIQNGNLLPDLVAKIGGEVLDVVDRIDDDRVGQMLCIERGELVGQR